MNDIAIANLRLVVSFQLRAIQSLWSHSWLYSFCQWWVFDVYSNRYLTLSLSRCSTDGRLCWWPAAPCTRKGAIVFGSSNPVNLLFLSQVVSVDSTLKFSWKRDCLTLWLQNYQNPGDSRTSFRIIVVSADRYGSHIALTVQNERHCLCRLKSW